MDWKPGHVSDEAFVLILEGELPPRRRRQAQRHMAVCPACRRRLTDISSTLADLTRDLRTASRPPLPPAAPSRARLQQRIAENADQSRAWLPGLPSLSAHGRWLNACTVLVLALCGVMFYSQRTPRWSEANADAGAFVVPRQDLTPGATRRVTIDEICQPPGHGSINAVPAAIHRSVFESYAADYRRAADYELDYLITPELGGTADARNLWPQPFTGTPWNAYVKDELERLFHRRVCDGAMELTAAQRELAGDWISAYKRHFQTDSPLREYARSPLGATDQEMVISELVELGVSPPPATGGPALVAMLHAARSESFGRLTAVR
jgi:hypothetical protein